MSILTQIGVLALFHAGQQQQFELNLSVDKGRGRPKRYMVCTIYAT